MSELNNNLVENGIDVIRNCNSNDVKIEFITNVIAATEIPSDFIKILRSKPGKIFYEIKDGEQYKREWVLFLENKFYCVYCVCFSPLSENRMVVGVDYVKGCRISEFLNSHGNESNHSAAKNRYSALVSPDNGENTCQLAKKNVIRSIVKIIIFIATHG